MTTILFCVVDTARFECLYKHMWSRAENIQTVSFDWSAWHKMINHSFPISFFQVRVLLRCLAGLWGGLLPVSQSTGPGGSPWHSSVSAKAAAISSSKCVNEKILTCWRMWPWHFLTSLSIFIVAQNGFLTTAKDIFFSSEILNTFFFFFSTLCKLHMDF